MSNHAYTSPTYNIAKRQRVYGTTNKAECKTPSPLGKSRNASTPLFDDDELESPGREHFVNGRLQPRHIQQRFLQKLNQERQAAIHNNSSSSIAYSNNPPEHSTQRVIERIAGDATIDKPNDSGHNEDDDDDMFGDDIPLEDLEEALVITETRHPIQQQQQQQQQQHPQLQQTPATPIPSQNHNNDDDDDDMFGDDIPTQLLDEALLACTTSRDEPSDQYSSRYHRYMVANIQVSCYDTETEKGLPEKILHLINEKEQSATVTLREGWLHTVIKIGDIVHIPTLHTNTKSGIITIINNTQGFIVVHPDRLLSSTAVAESTFCLRKSVLQQKIKAIGDYSEALVHGNMIHRIIQHALGTQDFSMEGLEREARRVVYSSLDELYAIDQQEETALQLIQQQLPSIKAFGDTYVGEQPKPNARVAMDMGVDVAKVMGCRTVAFSKILDVEEHLWSPTFGLKGMIDVSVEMKMHPNTKVLTLPLELKTGKSTRFISHRAQTTLYILLMSDRYGIDIDAAALYYSKMNSLYIVPAVRNDLRLLLTTRNNLASAMQSKHSLPPMLKNLHHCQSCTMNDACLQYHKAVENGDGDSSGLGGYFDKKIEHMDEAACNFFRHWLRLIDLEEEDIDYVRKDIWRQPAEMRELSGVCLSNMIIDPSYKQESESVYKFIRQDGNGEFITNSSLNVGDPIVISGTEGHINLGMGFILRLDQRYIMVNLTSPLRQIPRRDHGFNKETNQVFVHTHNPTTYRIDKDEMASGIALMRRNIVGLLAPNEGDENTRHKRLIVDREKPSFMPLPPLELPATLNPAQQNAVQKVLSAKDYAIILGMPGTGKTTTTSHIIRTLVERGKTVLLTSYTHSALDNVLSKVHASGIDVLRLGNPEKVMPSLRGCMPNGNPTLTTVERLEQFYSSKKVVGVTCLGIGHNLLQRRRFDYCIVDEASQITLPACVGPLRCADIFVLVGDQYQLPPLIRNDIAREHGMDKSLFQLLSEDHPEAVAVLEYQYRMNRDIMSITNSLVYDHKLKCANPAVASRQIKLPKLNQALAQIHTLSNECTQSPCWIKDVIDPSRKVVFIDTDKIPALEERVMERVQNPSEAKMVLQLAETLIAAGVPQQELAVISIYRSQLRLISPGLRGTPDVEVATIDKYQGRDKECILVSLVRSNEQGNTGDLLRDWRRINVAFTRAKSKLIVFGSRQTLHTSALFKSFLDLMASNEWIYELQPKAHELHTIEPSSPPSKQRKEHKTFSPLNAFLKHRPVLRDVYNAS